jgi:hypothetical protein
MKSIQINAVGRSELFASLRAGIGHHRIFNHPASPPIVKISDTPFGIRLLRARPVLTTAP